MHMNRVVRHASFMLNSNTAKIFSYTADLVEWFCFMEEKNFTQAFKTDLVASVDLRLRHCFSFVENLIFYVVDVIRWASEILISLKDAI